MSQEGKPAGPDIRTMVDDLSHVGSMSGSRGDLSVTGMSAFSPREPGNRTKVIIIAILAAAVLSVGGGSFYYFQIYRPAQYARAILGIYDRATAEAKDFGTTAIRDESDYAGALEAIQKQRMLAERAKSELAKLSSPPALAGISETFEEFLELNLLAFAETEPQAEFFKTAGDFRAEVKKFTAAVQPEPQQSGSGPVLRPSAPTAGAVRAVWEETVPRMQSLGEALFKKEISGLADPSYAELEAMWAKAGPGLPFLLGIIRKIGPQVAINTVPESLSKAELTRTEAAFDDLEKFFDLLDTAFSKSSAIDLLSFRAFPRQADLSERNFRLMQTIDGLRRDYAQ